MPLVITQPNTLLCKNCGFAPVGACTVPPSPVPNLLRTNSAPSTSEGQAIRRSLSDVQETISQLDQSIARPRQIQKTLEGERQALVEFSQKHQELFSPVRRVYQELWSEIFMHCSRGSCMPYGETQMKTYSVPYSFSWEDGPLKLAHVCQFWRATAISTPRLWTVLSISLHMINLAPLSQLALVQTWLVWSRSYPLSICFIGYGSELSVLGQVALPIFQILAKQSYRWENVHLLNPSDIINLLSIYTVIHLPVIKTFTFYNGMLAIANLDVFQFGPLLHTLCVGGPERHNLSVIELPRTTQLRHIKLGRIDQRPRISAETSLEVLRHWSNLETLQIHCDGYRTDNIRVPMPVHHAQLRSLTIIGFKRSRGYYLLDQLSLPCLEELHIQTRSSAHGHKEVLHQSIEDFSLRSPSLKKFRFDLTTFAGLEQDIVFCFRHMHALTHLHVSAKYCNRDPSHNEILRCLSFSEKEVGRDLLPQLQSIKVTGFGVKLGSRCIVDFLRSRWSHIGSGMRARIRSASMWCKEGFHDSQNIAALDDLRKEGLYVEIL